MTKYSLTEAYESIYNPRNLEDIFDNLRFVDYMLDEDIQEVIEGLVWEFRDYGNTLDEAFSKLDYAVHPQVITESYYVLMDDVLTEATKLTPQQRQQRIQRNRAYQQSSTAAADATQRNLRMRNRIDRVKSIISNTKKSLPGPIKSVKQGISGAAGGMGRAAKALGSGAVERGKALLKGLLRRGGQSATDDSNDTSTLTFSGRSQGPRLAPIQGPKLPPIQGPKLPPIQGPKLPPIQGPREPYRNSSR